MDQPWSISHLSTSTTAADAYYDDDQDLSVSDDMIQESNDETAMEETYNDESTHESQFEYSVDEDEDMDEHGGGGGGG
ncbi:hypothetical protein BGZ65_011156, partial [Modicella reniformis]